MEIYSERSGSQQSFPSIQGITSLFITHQRKLWVKVVSESLPRVVVFEKFLSVDEIDHVLKVASSHMSRSKVRNQDSQN